MELDLGLETSQDERIDQVECNQQGVRVVSNASHSDSDISMTTVSVMPPPIHNPVQTRYKQMALKLEFENGMLKTSGKNFPKLYSKEKADKVDKDATKKSAAAKPFALEIRNNGAPMGGLETGTVRGDMAGIDPKLHDMQPRPIRSSTFPSRPLEGVNRGMTVNKRESQVKDASASIECGPRQISQDEPGPTDRERR